MSRGYRLSVVALAGLILSAVAALSAPAPVAQRVPAPRPAITDAVHTQEREAKADKHDAEDLAAQIRAAKAAEEQIPPMWVAAFLTFAGTLLLIWNLTEARKANRIAREAIAQSEQHIQMQLRPQITAQYASLASSLALEQGQNNHGLRIDVTINVKNAGSGIARNVQVRAIATNSVGIDRGQFASDYFAQQIAFANTDTVGGDLLAAGEELEQTHGLMIMDAELTRILPIPASRFVLPLIAVIITYRAIGNERLMHTAKLFTVVTAGPTGNAMAIDLDNLPIPRGQAEITSFPLHAEAT